jgi:hypothetical protein
MFVSLRAFAALALEVSDDSLSKSTVNPLTETEILETVVCDLFEPMKSGVDFPLSDDDRVIALTLHSRSENPLSNELKATLFALFALSTDCRKLNPYCTQSRYSAFSGTHEFCELGSQESIPT